MSLIGSCPGRHPASLCPPKGGTDDQSTVVSKTRRKRLTSDGLVAAATLFCVVAITGLVVLLGWGEYFAHRSFAIVIGLIACCLLMVALAVFYWRFIRDQRGDRPDERSLTHDEQS